MSKVVFSLTLGVLSASAQLSTAVNELGNGRSQVTITNTSGVPLEALVVTWITPEPSGGRRSSLTYHDALLQAGFKTVPTTFMVGGAGRNSVAMRRTV